MISFTYHKKAGFTLIETLVAISILLIAIVGPMVLVTNGIKIAFYARDQITAVYLAQDALEAVRYLRDSDSQTNGVPANFGASIFSSGNLGSQCVGAGNWCRIDTIVLYERNAIGVADINAAVSNSYTNKLQLDSDGKYRYSGGNPTNYERHINIKPTASGNGMDVQVKVVWSSGVTNREYIVYQSLYFK